MVKVDGVVIVGRIRVKASASKKIRSSLILRAVHIAKYHVKGAIMPTLIHETFDVFQIKL